MNSPYGEWTGFGPPVHQPFLSFTITLSPCVLAHPTHVGYKSILLNSPRRPCSSCPWLLCLAARSPWSLSVAVAFASCRNDLAFRLRLIGSQRQDCRATRINRMFFWLFESIWLILW